MCNDVNAKLTLSVLNEVYIGVDTFGLVPPCQFGNNRRVGMQPAYGNRLEDKSFFGKFVNERLQILFCESVGTPVEAWT